MAYFVDPIRKVAKWFGARLSGGYQGVTLTDGIYNEYLVNINAAVPFKPGDVFPTGNGIKVIGINTTFVTGTVTAVTIGGVAVTAATEAAPVSIPDGNTGIVAQTGGTAGTLIIKFINIEGDQTHFY